MRNTITRRWAEAIREDVRCGNASDVARKRIGIDNLCFAMHPVSIRIGDNPTDVRHMDSRDFWTRYAVQPHWLRRSPRCRACAKLIKHGEKAIEFELRQNKDWGWSTTAYIHRDNCEGGE